MAPIPKPTRPSAFHPAPAVVESSPPPAFPLSSLSTPLSTAVSAVAAHTQAPLELIAHHLITLAAMPAQRLISVRLPTGVIQSVSCYFLTLVGSGEGRSAAERMCLDPVRGWERRFAAAAARMVDEKGRRLQYNSVRINLNPPPPEGAPEAEVDETKVCQFSYLALAPDQSSAPSATPSERQDHVFLSPSRASASDRYDSYARFGRRSALFAGRAAELLTASRARRNEADSLSALWDGRACVAGAHEEDLAPRLSVHLVATPAEGFALLRAPEVHESGLLGRMLVVQPASRIGTRAFHESDGAPPAALTALHARLTALYAREATATARAVSLDENAKQVWLAFAGDVEAAMAPGGAYARIRPLAGHLAEHALRLAAIIALVEDDALTALTPVLLARGIALARFYADEALRLLDVRVGPHEEADRVAVLQSWLARKHAGREISLRDIYRSGPGVLRSPSQARRAMRQIEMIGLAARVPSAEDTHENNGERWSISAGPENLSHDVA